MCQEMNYFTGGMLVTREAMHGIRQEVNGKSWYTWKCSSDRSEELWGLEGGGTWGRIFLISVESKSFPIGAP